MTGQQESIYAFITFTICLYIVGGRWTRSKTSDWNLYRQTLAALLPSLKGIINSVDDLNSLKSLTTWAMVLAYDSACPRKWSASNVQVALGGSLSCPCYGNRLRVYLGGLYTPTYRKTGHPIVISREPTRGILRQLKEMAEEICVDIWRRCSAFSGTAGDWLPITLGDLMALKQPGLARSLIASFTLSVPWVLGTLLPLTQCLPGPTACPRWSDCLNLGTILLSWIRTRMVFFFHKQVERTLKTSRHIVLSL